MISSRYDVELWVTGGMNVHCLLIVKHSNIQLFKCLNVVNFKHLDAETFDNLLPLSVSKTLVFATDFRSK